MFGSSNNPENNKRLKGSVQGDKKYPCSVCQKWPMLVPIYQCEQGHVICNPCSQNWYCGICKKKPVAKIRCTAVEHLQPELIKCDQCNMNFANDADLEEHVRAECESHIGVELCKILELDDGNCQVKCKPGKVADAIKHLKEVHGATGSQGKSAFDHRWQVLAVTSAAGLWFIAKDDAVVVVKVFKKDERKWIQIVSLGNNVELPKWKITIHLASYLRRLWTYAAVDSDFATYSQPLELLTSQNEGSYKERHLFDAGSTLMKLTKFEIEFQNGVANNDGQMKQVLMVGREVPR